MSRGEKSKSSKRSRKAVEGEDELPTDKEEVSAPVSEPVVEETADRELDPEEGVEDATDGRREASSLPTDKELPEKFSDMNISPALIEVLEKKGWIKPTPIQQQAIPAAMTGRDVIGLAVTGSGKTGAFAIPIIQSLLSGSLQKANAYYAIVVLPTRELCMQVATEFRILGHLAQLKVCSLVGGMSSVDQIKELARQPQVVCATPGRLVDHIQNTKGFSLAQTSFLVLDEADRLLSMDFEESLYEIVRACNPKRQTFLFSATMTTKLSKLQKACLKAPVMKIEVNERTSVAPGLKQHIVLVPMDLKFEYLAALLQQLGAKRTMVFCNTCKTASVLSAFLKKLQFRCIALAGDMNQRVRLNALAQFKSQQRNILIATEVAARGMDLPDVNYVINFDVPASHKDYIHRVGRTARAGAHGQSFTFITKLDVVQYKLIENKIFGAVDVDKLPQPFKGVSEDQTLESLVDLLTKSMNIREAKMSAEKDYVEAKRSSEHKKRRKA